MMGKVYRIKGDRKTREIKIQEALSNKPTFSFLSKKGLSSEDIKKLGGRPAKSPVRASKIQLANKRPVITKGIKITDASLKAHVTTWATPSWFTRKNNSSVDVSIIIPMFKSNEVIKEQIASWDIIDDGIKKEIIYVNDACPNNSHEAVLRTWEQRRNNIKEKVGLVLLHDKNQGYGVACNTGASFAHGKYLLFLNADCVVTPNWLKPMYDLILEDSNIGIVGNMQLRPNNNLDSAGSEWSWQTNSFEHIGRNVYNGKRLGGSFPLERIPEDLLLPAEREMVTGCCFIIPKILFDDLEGFDTQYRIGYWEDADINMRVRAAGYKVFYQPHSRIYHRLGHSKAGGHKHIRDNATLFRNRWINTGRIDELVKAPRAGGLPTRKDIHHKIQGKITGCVIACNEEEFLEPAVDSLSSFVHDWVFVIGGNEFAYKSGMCGADGYPTDNTLDIAHKLVDKYGGTVITPPGRLWKDKVEMRNAYAARLVPNDWMFMLDGDEVYKEEQIWRIAELMRSYEVLVMQFWVFWNNTNTIGTGTWEECPQERVVKWKDGHAYRGTNHLFVSAKNGKLARDSQPSWAGQEKLFYHYSWVRPIEKIRQKLRYYKYQSHLNNEKYVDDVFLKWRESPNSVQGKTHPMGGGNTKPFPGIHPQEVQKLINQGKLNFN